MMTDTECGGWLKIRAKQGWLLFAVLAVALTSARAGDKSISDVSGYYSIPISAGPNFISVPLHPLYHYRDMVVSVSSNTVTFTNTASFTANQFAPSNSFDQFILLVRRDADKAESATNNVAGDWWPIDSNSTTAVTVDSGGEDLSLSLAAGDVLEVRKLVSMRELFGHGANCFMLKDSDGDGSESGEDVIRFMQGVYFGAHIFYHDGTLTEGQEGYILDGNGPYDGSHITLKPGQPIMYYRKTGSGETNLVMRGQVQNTRLTMYLAPSVETFGPPFAATNFIGHSGLREVIEAAGATSANLIASTSLEDVLRRVVGVSFVDSVILHTNSAFYSGGVQTNNYAFLPGAGWAYYIKPSTGGRAWRQSLPYSILPTNYVPELQLLAPELALSTVQLTLAAHETNRAYSLYWRSNLNAGANWTLITNGATAQNQFTNLIQNASNAFFIAFSNLDTDGDGLSDGYEWVVTRTSKDSTDTDGDGVSDALELLLGRNPLVAGTVADDGSSHLTIYTRLR